jgi:hypothetical protein
VTLAKLVIKLRECIGLKTLKKQTGKQLDLQNKNGRGVFEELV